MIAGPREEKEAMLSLERVAPTENAPLTVTGISFIVSQLPPSFPAETTTIMPAFRNKEIAFSKSST